jgi:glycosyltransferase involved in cell wall biosynthesis
MLALELSLLLRQRGHAVRLACPPGSRIHAGADAAGLATFPLNVRGYAHPLLALRLSRLLRAEGIQIVHCEHSRDLATAVPAVLLSGRRIPIILTRHVGSYLQKRDPFHRFTYHFVSRVVAISSVIRRNVIETTPMRPERVLVIHNGVDLATFTPERGERDTARREFGYGDQDCVVGMVGRLSPGKGHEELLKAVSILHRQYSEVRALVVGGASHNEEAYAEGILRMARSLGLEGVVTFTGYRTDIPALLSATDIFAFPSHAEAFGLVLIEAMAMEKPVVSTNCDGVLDIVEDGVSGILVPPRSAEDLARALGSLVRDTERRTALARGGRARAMTAFDRERQIRSLEDLYGDVLREAPPSS